MSMSENTRLVKRAAREAFNKKCIEFREEYEQTVADAFGEEVKIMAKVIDTLRIEGTPMTAEQIAEHFNGEITIPEIISNLYHLERYDSRFTSIIHDLFVKGEKITHTPGYYEPITVSQFDKKGKAFGKTYKIRAYRPATFRLEKTRKIVM